MPESGRNIRGRTYKQLTTPLMIPRSGHLEVNPLKSKQLTNFRSHGEGKGIQLSPKVEFSLERAIEYIAPDEYVEATPKNLRLRKRILDFHERRRQAKAAAR